MTAEDQRVAEVGHDDSLTYFIPFQICLFLCDSVLRQANWTGKPSPAWARDRFEISSAKGWL